jgi:peptide methionine sulfoxide reductase msrA/msrB
MKRKIVIIFAVLAIGIVWYGSSIRGKADEDLTKFEVATFAGGCFWCMEAAFEAEEGVAESISGYSGGVEISPTYEEVSRGQTGHLEAVQIYYSPEIITYRELLDIFWRNIDPTDDGGQFVDRGSQYKTAIFYHNDTQRTLAEKSKQKLEASGRFDEPIVTQILEFKSFYKAEEYHQDYYKKRVLNYELYSRASGREEFKEEYWEE